MKPKLILCLTLVLSGVLSGCSTTETIVDHPTLIRDSTKPLAGLGAATNSFHRVSSAEINGVRLEVEQPYIHHNEIQIRVRDYAARNWQKESVSCDLYGMSDDGTAAEMKFMSVTLKQISSDSNEYSGTASNRVEFEHGNKFRVVYKSNGLPLPISTWYACYYH